MYNTHEPSDVVVTLDAADRYAYSGDAYDDRIVVLDAGEKSV